MTPSVSRWVLLLTRRSAVQPPILDLSAAVRSATIGRVAAAFTAWKPIYPDWVTMVVVLLKTLRSAKAVNLSSLGHATQARAIRSIGSPRSGDVWDWPLLIRWSMRRPDLPWAG